VDTEKISGGQKINWDMDSRQKIYKRVEAVGVRLNDIQLVNKIDISSILRLVLILWKKA
jgi:hypothetical protein